MWIYLLWGPLVAREPPTVTSCTSVEDLCSTHAIRAIMCSETTYLVHNREQVCLLTICIAATQHLYPLCPTL